MILMRSLNLRFSCLAPSRASLPLQPTDAAACALRRRFRKAGDDASAGLEARRDRLSVSLPVASLVRAPFHRRLPRRCPSRRAAALC
jgi:hypothetical protein